MLIAQVDVEHQGRWSYNRFEGLTVKNVTTMDNGTYECVGERGGQSAKMKFSILVTGIEENCFIFPLKKVETFELCNRRDSK